MKSKARVNNNKRWGTVSRNVAYFSDYTVPKDLITLSLTWINMMTAKNLVTERNFIILQWDLWWLYACHFTAETIEDLETICLLSTIMQKQTNQSLLLYHWVSMKELMVRCVNIMGEMMLDTLLYGAGFVHRDVVMLKQERVFPELLLHTIVQTRTNRLRPEVHWTLWRRLSTI